MQLVIQVHHPFKWKIMQKRRRKKEDIDRIKITVVRKLCSPCVFRKSINLELFFLTIMFKK